MRATCFAFVACIVLSTTAHAAPWSMSGEENDPPVTKKSYTSAGDIKNGSHEEPGFFERMSTGTRSFFTRMNRTLTGGGSKAKTRQVSDRRSASRKGSGFSSWFQPEEPAPPRTVDEWLSLERPKTP